MSRRVQGPPPGAEYWFTPTAFGNAEAPDADRVRVKLRYPTEADKRRADKAAASTTFRFDRDGKIMAHDDGTFEISVKDADAEEAKRFLLDAHVLEVAGYEDSTGAAISSGAELFEHGETEIVDEVVAELRFGLAMSADEKKRCAESSDLLSLGPSLSDGPAQSADDSACSMSADISEIEITP